MDGGDSETPEEFSPESGKEWLKPFSAALAQLDHVSNKVYNISPSHPNVIKSRAKSQRVDFGVPDAQPPLSNLHRQSCAWGSDASIPDLIRKQSERQKSREKAKNRPESAKVRRQTRPPSGRKPRPQSAKDSTYHESSENNEIAKFNYVKGALCILTDRPPEGLKYHGNIGLVAPPAMADAISYDTILDQIAQAQTSADHVPPAPCASPNFIEVMEANPYHSDLEDPGDLDFMVDTQTDRGPAPLLRRPTAEPIKLSLPQAQLEDNDVEEELLLSDTEGCYGNNSFDNDNEDDLPQREDVKLQNKSLDAANFGYTNAWDSPKLNRNKNAKKGSRVTFSGVTFSDGEGQETTSKERFNPGSKVTNSQLIKKEPRPLKTRTDSLSKLTGGDGDASKSKGKISVVSVTYIDDPDVSMAPVDSTTSLTERGVSQSHRAHKKRKNFAQKKEIESQMSLLSLSDEESRKNDNADLKNFNHTSQTDNQTSHDQHKQPEETEINKTVKTLEFGESGVQETKTIEKIDSPAPNQKPPYQVTRPMSGRPGSSLRSGSASTMSGSNILEKREHFRRGSSHDSGVKSNSRPPSGQRHGNHKSFDDTKQSTNGVQAKDIPENFITPIIKAPPVEEKLFVKRNNLMDNSRPPSQNENKKSTLDNSDDMKAKLLRVASAPTPSQRKVSIDYGKPRPKSAAVPNKNDDLGQLSVLNMEKPSYFKGLIPTGLGIGKKEEPKKVVEIWTRREDTEIETEGVKHCKQIQAKMIDNGIPIALETLKRALLPPTEYATHPGYQTNSIDKRTALPSYNSGLLSKPSTWFPAEYKRLLKAKRLVREAKAALDAQRKEEERKSRIMYLDPTAAPEPSPMPEEEITKKKKRKRRGSSAQRRPSIARPNSGR